MTSGFDKFFNLHGLGRGGFGFLTLVAGGLIAIGSVTSAQDMFTFEFVDNGVFDQAGAGAFMDVTEGTQTMRLTTLDVQAPAYELVEGVLQWDGTSYTSAVTNVNVFGSSSRLGVDNPTVASDSVISDLSPGTEYREFNVGEYWDFAFDTEVIVTGVQFSSLNNNDHMQLSVEGDTSLVEYDTSLSGDYAAFPFGILSVEAGQFIRVQGGDGADTLVHSIEVLSLGEIVSSVMTGSADSGATWDSAQPVASGAPYRIVDGHEVTFDTGFPGFLLHVANGTAVVNTGTLNAPLLAVDETGVLNASGPGDIELGDINELPPMVLNGVLNATANVGADLFLDYDITGAGEVNFEGNGPTSDLWLSAVSDLNGVIRFNGSGDNVRITESEGLGGTLEMNSTGANTIVAAGGGGIGGEVVFNEPGVIKAVSDLARLQAPARLTANADVTIEMLAVAQESGGNQERRFFMPRTMRGSSDIHVVGAPIDTTDVPGKVTLNEFESGSSTAAMNSGQRWGAYSGVITTQDFVNVELRHSYPRAAVVVSQDGRLEVGRLINSGNAGELVTPETVTLGDITVESGGVLTVGYEEVPDGSASAADAIIQPNVLSLAAAGDRAGSLTLAEGATTVLPLIGLQPGLGFGVIEAEGDVFLDGELQVVINAPQRSGHPLEGSPYAATIGDTFDFITSAVSVPDGDYNRDGGVGQADFDLWLDSYGALDDHRADGNNDGVVDSIDYAIWRENLGALGDVTGSISGAFESLTIVDDTGVLAAAGATLAVNYISSNLVQLEVVAAGAGALTGREAPEPTSLALIGAACAGLCFLSRNRVR